MSEDSDVKLVDVVVENLLLVRGLREAVKEVERLIRLQEPYAENLQGFARLLGIQWVHTNPSAMLSRAERGESIHSVANMESYE